MKRRIKNVKIEEMKRNYPKRIFISSGLFESMLPFMLLKFQCILKCIQINSNSNITTIIRKSFNFLDIP